MTHHQDPPSRKNANNFNQSGQQLRHVSNLGTIYSFTDIAFLARRDVARSLLKGVTLG